MFSAISAALLYYCYGCHGYICDWKEDEKLYDCGGKDLTEIPQDVPAQAEKLNLYENRISAIEAGSFSGLTALKELDMGSNSIRALNPEMWEGLGGSLETLVLSGNDIQRINSGDFAPLSNLEVLSLAFCTDLTELKAGAFTGLSKLEYLDLGFSSISAIESGAFENLDSIERLELPGNSLGRISKEMWVGAVSVQELILYNTGITTIVPNAFESLVNLENTRFE